MMLSGSAIRLTGSRAAAAALSTLSSQPSLGLSSLLLNNSAQNRDVIASFSSMSLSSPSPAISASAWQRKQLGKNTKLPPQNELSWKNNDNKHNRSFSSKPKEGGKEETISGSSQHDTWVDFQRSIAVSGFETGQTVTEKILGRKHRGGKANRKMKEREAELAAAMSGQDISNLKGGEFPALRYSDEETERLLAQAYAAIPPRAGKRGTRNLKRQKRRWFIKRQYDAKKKHERIAEHERRMAKRHEISQAMYKMRVDAVDVRESEQAYQREILERWAEMMGHAGGEGEESVAGEKEVISS